MKMFPFLNERSFISTDRLLSKTNYAHVNFIFHFLLGEYSQKKQPTTLLFANNGEVNVFMNLKKKKKKANMI